MKLHTIHKGQNMKISRTYKKHDGTRNRHMAEAVCLGCGSTVEGRKETIAKQELCRSCAAKKKHTTHGMAHTRIYHIWQGIKSRCQCKTDTGYHQYGAKGVTVCQEWRDDFVPFYAWAKENGYTDTLTIEREDPCGNYEPKNCSWIPRAEQEHNKRSVAGVSKTKYGWAAEVSHDGKRWRKKFKRREDAVAWRNDRISEHNLPNQRST